MKGNSNNTTPTAGAPTAKPKCWYATRDLAHDDLDVVVLVGEGEIVARRKTISRRRESSTIWCAREIVREPGRPTRYRYRDLPPHLQITCWRPLAGFPGPLPAPTHLTGEVKWQTPPEPPAPPTDELDWPHEYAEAPHITAREVEIRVLRALRTDGSAAEGGVDVRPAGYRDSVAILARNHLVADEFVDANYIGPVGEAWEPTRRDRSDYLQAMAWFTKLTAAQRGIIKDRSLNPPYSFRLIGERASKSAEWARKRYRRAIAAVTKVANAVTGVAQAGGNQGSGGLHNSDRKSR